MPLNHGFGGGGGGALGTTKSKVWGPIVVTSNSGFQLDQELSRLVSNCK